MSSNKSMHLGDAAEVDNGGTSANEEEYSKASFRCRKMSDTSEKSVKSEVKWSALAYDSGNYSNSSNESEVTCPLEMELHNHCQHVHSLLRERDHALLIAMQDVRKLRSELERLNKSEEWYKKELRAQKITRLEALERLYAQERKYMQENQRLQRECVRLYDKCGDLEKELQLKRNKGLQKLVEEETKQSITGDADVENNNFEMEQQRTLIGDQEKLIKVLRKQKHGLLEDLRRLNEERDTKVLELQEILAGVEVENTHMTAQCKRLLTERQALEETLHLKDATLSAENAEKLRMAELIEELKEQSNSQREALAHKEREIQELRKDFAQNMQKETNMDEVHRISVSYHHEIHAKTAEIITLKKSLQALQIELDNLTDLQAQNEEHLRQIEQLNFYLEAQKCELTHLKETDEEKTQQISELQHNLEKMRAEHEVTLEKINIEQVTLKNVKSELIALHEQYASMCAVCERTRFELELLEIESSKMKFQADIDKREIELLREKLKGYLKQTEDLGTKINELEAKLECSNAQNGELVEKLKAYEDHTPRERKLYKENESDVKIAPKINYKNYVLDEKKTLSKSLNQDKQKLESNEKIHANFRTETGHNGDDSGFLDTSIECLDWTETVLEKKRGSDCFDLAAAHNVLLQQLSSQKTILNERKAIIAELGKHICNGSRSTTNRDSDILACDEDKLPSDELLQRQQQLVKYLSNQSLLTLEKRQLLEAFETLINATPMTGEGTSVGIEDILKMKNQLKEKQKLKIKEEAVKDPIGSENLTEDKAGENNEDKKMLVNFKNQGEQLQSDENGERHLREKSDQTQLHTAQFQHYEFTIQRLQVENQRLIKEIQTLQEAKSSLESTLDTHKQLVAGLQLKVTALEVNKSVGESINAIPLPKEQELLTLRAKVKQLETSLASAMQEDREGRNDRVRLIQQLIEQQNSKVKQLTQSQEEWEELLEALKIAQKLEENTRTELLSKHTELEELNALFAEQNEELRRLQEMMLQSEANDKNEEDDEMRRSHEKEVEQLQAKLSAQLVVSEARQHEIEELRSKNERLERHLNEDYAEEIADKQKQLRTLQTKVENLQAEKKGYAERLAGMECEMQLLKKNKRDALVLPPEFVVLPANTISTTSTEASSSSCDGNGSPNASDSDNNDRMRILSKVLEAEYRRKMKRYDLHIHTLLANVKKLKKTLRAAEQRAANLTLEHSRTKDELHDLQLTKRQLEEMRLKCEHNQGTIKALERALEIERKKYESSDLGKAASYTRDSAAETLSADEPVHEVANLIDDYKKLIQQSALVTRRPKTSAILELIQRSNQCVPNLHKLETTVDGLRNDLDHFISAHTTSMRQQAANANKFDGLSLMDELRAAAESY
ncbi:myosin-11 [Ceratitis capitata]|uniref:myosin-11 n=1 Tax=Ceratitis capitata TaxID=7213 RepID=UPI00032A207E|nr:myosin-11 [Ceratitis capitata]